ncbi:MAG TPA: DUF1134 domain-containing protein [Thiobacillaceae bacterium]|nr:DUF1134 domain-containing protein [Thiobacillaceae bacterium]HNU63393.1 DUF1134 domain-containing protein [Thiobacillaceae bacterium]
MLLVLSWPGPARAADESADAFDEATILKEAKEFFGEATEGLGMAVEKAFREHGRPNGYIKGEEISGAITVGLSYGKGEIILKNGGKAAVYWQGPSVGFDLGLNASKVFTLVYNLPNLDAIYQRYPGVDGSLYFVAGVGMNYQKRGDTVLAPIRLGVGWRTGASVGYLHYTRSRRYFPL